MQRTHSNPLRGPSLVRHRVNTVAALRALPPQEGAEFDVRSRGSRLILNHEPYAGGDALERYLDCYASARRSGLLIFNPKEDGLDAELLALARRYAVENFFLLDLTLPSLVRLTLRERVPQAAVRVSEFEPEEAALRFRGRANWIWLDCFTGRPPSAAAAARLGRSFSVCLVSPELQGYARERIAAFRPLAAAVDAVCTKHPEAWAGGR